MTVMRRSISRLEHRLLRTTRVGSTRILLFADDVPEMSFFNENSDVRGVRAHVSVYGVASRQCVRGYQSRITLILVTFSYPSLATILLEYYIISFLLHLLMSSNAKCKNSSHPSHFLISLTCKNTTRMLRKTLTPTLEHRYPNV